jgi:hypothetical protein
MTYTRESPNEKKKKEGRLLKLYLEIHAMLGLRIELTI